MDLTHKVIIAKKIMNAHIDDTHVSVSGMHEDHIRQIGIMIDVTSSESGCCRYIRIPKGYFNKSELCSIGSDVRQPKSLITPNELSSCKRCEILEDEVKNLQRDNKELKRENKHMQECLNRIP